MGLMRVLENFKFFWYYFFKVLQEKYSGDFSGDFNELQKFFLNFGVVVIQLIFWGLKYSWKGSGNVLQLEELSLDNFDWVQL